MIITVTLNPAIDKTVQINKLIPGGLNRITDIVFDAGGKGINVSKTLKVLGMDSMATGFLGIRAGNLIEECLDKAGVKYDFVPVEGITRTNTKVADKDGTITELNEPGPEIQVSDLYKLNEKLRKYTVPGNIFVFAGNVPKGVGKDIYYELIKSIKESGAKCFLDADGELLKSGMAAGPDMIKPNREELCEYFGSTDRSEENIIRLGKKLISQGVKLAAVSCGGDGAIFFFEKQVIKCPALKVKVKSTVGAGDAMVAAMLYSIENGFDEINTAKLCMAVSAGAVTTVGTKPASLEVIQELMKKVEFENIL